MIEEQLLEPAIAADQPGEARHRPGAKRLDANRIFLYVWPTIEVPLNELGEFARAAAPLTAGAGLEARPPQPSRAALEYWASGLEQVYLEGAYQRSR